MGAIIVPLVLVVVIVVVLVAVVRRSVREHDETHETLADPEAPSLRYQVPAGQDPAAVLASLRGAGYTATADDRRLGDKALLISGPDGQEPDREAVRRVLAGESKLNYEDDTIHVASPRFEDE